MKIRIGTWNIAGARKMLSTKRFDYSEGEELAYFADQLRLLDLDIICLQESHTNQDDSLTKRLADLLGISYVAETPGCPSHIDSAYQLTTAIISRVPFATEKALLLPSPTFELKYVHNNRVVPPYDRYVQVATFDGFSIATMHTEPLGAFGMQYDAGEGKTLADAIDKLLAGNLSRPLLFAADFNMDTLPGALPLSLEGLGLQEALPNKPTKPQGEHPDHILYTPEWQLLGSDIVQTASDHFLCWGEFELR